MKENTCFSEQQRVTVKQACEWGAQILRLAGIDSYRLDARVLLGHVIGQTSDVVYSHPEKEISNRQRDAYKNVIERRAACEPVAYVTGEKEFWGRAFTVTSATLIPRPETETLIEFILAQFSTTHPLSLLDLGTGSGCIALTVLCEYPKATAVAVDSSGDALEIARRNAHSLGVADRCRFVESDWDNAVEPEMSADLVVSNPPYIAHGELASLSRDVRDYEPHQALLAGDDGLQAYREVADVAHRRMAETGCTVIESGAGQDAAITDIFHHHAMHCIARKQDLSGITRALAFTHNE